MWRGHKATYLQALDHGRSGHTDAATTLQRQKEAELSRRSPDAMVEAAYTLPHRSHRCLGILAGSSIHQPPQAQHGEWRSVVSIGNAGLHVTGVTKQAAFKARCNYGLDYAAFAMTLDRDAEHSLRLGNGIRSSYEDSLQQTPCLDDDAVRRFGA